MSLQHWLLATRPRTLPAAVAPVVLASALAAYTGHFRGDVLAATLAISLLLQVGTNLAAIETCAQAEVWLGKPVLAINAITYWDALRRSGIEDKIHGCGSVLERF